MLIFGVSNLMDIDSTSTQIDMTIFEVDLGLVFNNDVN